MHRSWPRTPWRPGSAGRARAVQGEVEEGHGPSLVQGLVAVATLRRLDARRASRRAFARRRSRHGSRRASSSPRTRARRSRLLRGTRRTRGSSAARVRVEGGRDPADVPPVGRRDQGQHPDGGVLRGVAAPGMAASGTPHAPSRSAGMVHHTALVGSERTGRSSGCSPMTSPVGSRRRKEVTWVVTSTSPKRTRPVPTGAMRSTATMSNADIERAWVDQPGVADARPGRSPRRGRADDDVRVALMDVDRAGVDRGVRPRRVDRPRTRPVRSSTMRTVSRAAQRHLVGGSFALGPEPPGRPSPQHTGATRPSSSAHHGRPEVLLVRLGERQLGGSRGRCGPST